MTKFCENCGTPLKSDDTKFCTSCGAGVVPQIVPPYETESNTNKDQKSASGKKRSFWLPIAILVLIFAGAVFYFVSVRGYTPFGPVDGTTCDDGNLCTDNDYYQNGVCAPGPKRSCDDRDANTADTCDRNSGDCKHTKIGPVDGTSCDDGNLCTDNDYYQNGVCAPGPKRSCDDGDANTADSCDRNSGDCKHTKIAPGPLCDLYSCDDGKSDTQDYCDYKTGECINTKRTATTWMGALPRTDLKGSDLPIKYDVTNPPDSDYTGPEYCALYCLNEPDCKAATYVYPGNIQGPQAWCYLKKVVPVATSNTNCISFYKYPL